MGRVLWGVPQILGKTGWSDMITQAMAPRRKGDQDPRVTVAGRVPPATADTLRRIAEHQRRTVSQIVEFALTEYVARHPLKIKPKRE